MILILGAIVARADSLDELRHESLAHVGRSRMEDGCISHAVHIDCENSRRLVFVERWRDSAALDQHFAQPGSGEFVAAVRRLAEATEGMTIYDSTALS